MTADRKNVVHVSSQKRAIWNIMVKSLKGSRNYSYGCYLVGIDLIGHTLLNLPYKQRTNQTYISLDVIGLNNDKSSDWMVWKIDDLKPKKVDVVANVLEQDLLTRYTVLDTRYAVQGIC
jgi:hypothetical protein